MLRFFTTTRLLVAAACMLVAGQTAHAQASQPVVLVHGFLSNGSTWQHTAARLQQEFRVTAYTPTLNEGRRYSQQGQELNQFVNGNKLPDTTVLIGHSNGGLVSRTATLTRPYKGVVTVGSPHAGAPLAQWALNNGGYHALNVLDSRLMDVQVGLMYEFLGRGWWWAWIAVDHAFMATQFLIDGITIGMYTVMLTHDVLNDMTPNSPHLQMLNNPVNLIRESSTLNTHGITVIADNDILGGPFRLVLDAQTALDFSAALAGVGITLQILAQEWMWSIDWFDWWWWEKQRAAESLLMLGLESVYLPITWCRLVGGTPPGVCARHDGVVPAPSQMYPGTGNYIVTGPSHLEETSSTEVYEGIARVLDSDLRIPRR